jgi:hypothetical protein
LVGVIIFVACVYIHRLNSWKRKKSTAVSGKKKMPIQQLNSDSYPDHIYVSGMPFQFHGWNGKYQKSHEVNGHPVYSLDFHWLYNMIPIVPTHIYYDATSEQWIFSPENAGAYCRSKHLFGRWQDFTVSKFARPWFSELKVLAGVSIASSVALCLLYKKQSTM